MPLVLTDTHGNDYLVKLKGSGDGIQAQIVEWIVSSLARYMGLAVPHLCLMTITPELAGGQKLDQEVQDLVERSTGRNICRPYMTGARDYTPADRDRISATVQETIFLFDLWVLNVDRSPANPNILIDGNHAWCIDFAACMRLYKDVAAETPHAWLTALRRHIFYRSTADLSAFVRRMGALRPEEYTTWTAGLPQEWLDMAGDSWTREALDGRLQAVLAEADLLKRNLDVLAEMKPESEAERRKRARRNRELFEARHRIRKP